MKPYLAFACELESAQLTQLFSDPKLLEQLKALQARVCLGILDLSNERARVVQKLNKAGIPVTAWLLLPRDQGYWFNRDNAAYAAIRYGHFKNWTTKFNLKWVGLGIDIEPDFRIVQQMRLDRSGGFQHLLRGYFDHQGQQKALMDYRTLVTLMRYDGFFVEAYQFPVIMDERRAGSNILQRAAGIVDLDVDREVLMLYSSFMRKYGAGILWSYATNAQSVGVGSTGGGVELEGLADTRPLTWEELTRDLLLAASRTPHVFIFSLEGCVKQGFMPRLVNFDWNQSVEIPRKTAYQVGVVRRAAHGILWMLSHPWPVLLGSLGVLGLIALLLRRNENR